MLTKQVPSQIPHCLTDTEPNKYCPSKINYTNKKENRFLNNYFFFFAFPGSKVVTGKATLWPAVLRTFKAAFPAVPGATISSA